MLARKLMMAAQSGGGVGPWPVPYNTTYSVSALVTGNGAASAQQVLSFSSDGPLSSGLPEGYITVDQFFDTTGGPATNTKGPFYMFYGGLTPSEVEMQVTQTSGPTVNINQLSTFVDMATTRTLSHTVSVPSGPDVITETLVFDVTIREIANPANSVTVPMTLQFNVTSEP